MVGHRLNRPPALMRDDDEDMIEEATVKAPSSTNTVAS
jgi:hypothetical protein